MSNEQDLETQIEKLLGSIQNYCSTEMSDEVQHLLADLIKAINLARKANELNLIASIEISFQAITAEKPNLILAKEITESVMTELKGGKTKLSPAVRVVMGLGCLLYIAIPLLAYVLPKWMNKEHILGIPTELFLMVAMFGAVGSIVSIMVRIQDFMSVDVKDHFILYFTGFFKPIIGLSFALFLLALIKSGWVPLDIKTETENYFFMAIAFIAGFSERFARDIVSNIETKIIKATENAG
ncbi:MAG: hypothetical protein GQ569_10800 [Methylococcaceae bacterium]|nr:hypothetical protein [Methylococcaceae bacterium]